MTSDAIYSIRWRGRETGPFSVADIEERLDAHEVGLWHEILHKGRWVTLKDFIEDTGKISRALTAIPLASQLPVALSPELSGAQTNSTAKQLSRRWRLTYAGLGLLYLGLCLTLSIFNVPYAKWGLIYAVAGPGLHNLYAGRWLYAAAQIAAGGAFVWLEWPVFWLGFWPAIEVMFIWRDGRGFAMK